MIEEVQIEDLDTFRVIDGAYVVGMAFSSTSFDNINTKDINIDFENRTVIDDAYLVEDGVNGDAVNHGKYAPVNKIYADNSGSMYSEFVDSDLEGYNLIKCYGSTKYKVFAGSTCYVYVRDTISVNFTESNDNGDLYVWLNVNEPGLLLDASCLKFIDTADEDNRCDMNNTFDITTTPDGYYILKDNGAIVPYKN